MEEGEGEEEEEKKEESKHHRVSESISGANGRVYKNLVQVYKAQIDRNIWGSVPTRDINTNPIWHGTYRKLFLDKLNGLTPDELHFLSSSSLHIFALSPCMPSSVF